MGWPYVSNIKGKGEDSKWSSGYAKGRAYQWANHYLSKACIPGPSTCASQIARDEVAEEGGNTDDEIERFTFVTEDTPQPSS